MLTQSRVLERVELTSVLRAQRAVPVAVKNREDHLKAFVVNVGERAVRVLVQPCGTPPVILPAKSIAS